MLFRSVHWQLIDDKHLFSHLSPQVSGEGFCFKSLANGSVIDAARQFPCFSCAASRSKEVDSLSRV